MKTNWSNTHTTNFLLFLIVILLVVLVVQNKSKTPIFPPDLSPPPMMDEPRMNPHQTGEGMDSSSAMFAGFSCPENPRLSLSDSSCLGPKANTRREAIQKIFEQNIPVSQVFDQVISRFGEEALTPEAREIRKNRPSK